MNIINTVIRDFIVMLPLAWSERYLYGLVQGSLHCATQQGLAIYEIQISSQEKLQNGEF